MEGKEVSLNFFDNKTEHVTSWVEKFEDKFKIDDERMKQLPQFLSEEAKKWLSTKNFNGWAQTRGGLLAQYYPGHERANDFRLLNGKGETVSEFLSRIRQFLAKVSFVRPSLRNREPIEVFRQGLLIEIKLRMQNTEGLAVFDEALRVEQEISKERPESEKKKLKAEKIPIFPSPFIDAEDDGEEGANPRPLEDYQMMNLSGSIRSKPNWEEKMKNPEITAKWKEESIAQGLRPEAVEYVLQELSYYASRKQGSMEISEIDGVWQADNYIPSKLKEQLIQQVQVLENVPESEKDWHPGTNQQVLDLVHPSLYCYVENQSLVVQRPAVPALSFMGAGISKTQKIDDNYFNSKKYQWLPSHFDVDEDGKVKIQSYINNLHPVKHKSLYFTLGSIFEKFVPLFEQVLADSVEPIPVRVHVDPYRWYEGQVSSTEMYENNYDRRTPYPGQIATWKGRDPPKSIQLRGRTLQVIVKLANIILTPKNPVYNGGSWHVEGMKNENIVASGIYYYISENITDSRLAFRQAVCEPGYEQSDDRGIEAIYGLKNEEALSQVMGSVITKEDRCIAFPNAFQHQVQPFELKDNTKNGYRKILVFFLVDPFRPVELSTLYVPPQQKEWLLEVLQKLFGRKLPFDVIKLIVKFVDWGMDLNTAKKHREQLMAERKYFIQENNTKYFERPFSLCEH